MEQTSSTNNQLKLGIKIGVSLLGSWLIWSILNFWLLPAYNIQSFAFWFFILILIFLNAGLFSVVWKIKKIMRTAFTIDGIILAFLVVASIPSWLIWFGNDQRYQSLISFRELPGEEYARRFLGASPNPNQNSTFILPVIDKELSISLAMGKLGPYGAQFQINTEIFTAVNISKQGKQRLVRVSPLEYSSDIVAFNLANQGTAGYIQVDQITGQAELIEVPQGLKYLHTGFWDYQLERHLRRLYPFDIFGGWSFEIDDEGQPWWVVPVIHFTVGLFGGEDVRAVILVNPATGEAKWYELGEEPTWLDRIYPSQMVLNQATDYFGLKNGWFNLIFGSMTGVFQPSDGYTYVSTTTPTGGNTYLISGITSPNENDQTSVGVMLVNLKNKEAQFFKINGITEMRAVQIAENDERVRAQKLQASWPILVPINNHPTYFLILKNDFQRQRFVLIEATNGAQVSMADTYESVLSQYSTSLGFVSNTSNLISLEGIVSRMRREPNSTLVFLLSGDRENVYIVNEMLNQGTRFLQPNDRIQFKYRESLLNERIVIELENLSIR